jgi:CheY-like chemotaxis protein
MLYGRWFVAATGRSKGCRNVRRREAIDVLERRRDIELVITDINMPGSMDGLRLAAAIRDRWPPIHLIVVTGVAPPSSNDLPSGSVFIPKPYMPADILSGVQHFQ